MEPFLFVGIDHSMTSPGVCVYYGDPLQFCYTRCSFLYFSDKEKVSDVRFFRASVPKRTPQSLDMERYDGFSSQVLEFIGSWMLSGAGRDWSVRVAVEGYSFGSSGKVFQIAENQAVLCHSLWKRSIPFVRFAPSEVKKLATGKGNAKKDQMHDAFFAETGVNLAEKFGTSSEKNPVCDLVDAYFILKCLINRHIQTSRNQNERQLQDDSPASGGNSPGK